MSKHGLRAQLLLSERESNGDIEVTESRSDSATGFDTSSSEFALPNWIRIANVADIPTGTGRELMAGSNIVALFHVGDEFHALDGICPHAGGPLGEGALSGDVVTCPWHGWQFHVKTGHHCLNPRILHRTFPVEVRGDEVFVDVDAP